MATKLKLKLKDVRGDVRVGAVPGADAIHALKDEPENGRNVPLCPTRTKNPIQLWGPAMAQKPELELCAACSKVVPTGDVVVTEEPVRIPGLDLTVTQTVITPDATSLVSAELHAEDDHMTQRWERCALDSVEVFAADARRILMDASELRSDTLDAANWTELYEWFTREEDMPKNTKTTHADSPQFDVDELISTVHATVDQIKAIDPSSEDAATQAGDMRAEADELIRKLPRKHHTTLRKAVNDAVKAVTAAPKPEAPASTEVAMSDNPADYAGVAEVMAQGVSKVREGVELGLKLTTAGEEMARIMLNMRSLVPNPDTGLPDITAQRKTTRNFAAKIYADARKDVAETDVERLGAHNSLVKATQNKMSDVLVDWLNALDAPESAEVVRELFPRAADMLAGARETAADAPEGATVAVPRPSDAIRALYAEKGIELPVKGRTELMREHRKRKALEAARKEREDLVDSEEPGTQEELEKVDAKIRDLAADLGDAAEPEPEKSDAERAAEALEKLRKSVDTTTRRYNKLSGNARNKVKGELYALIRHAVDTFDLDLSALAADDQD